MFKLDQLTVLIYTTRKFCFDMLLRHGGGPMGTEIQKLKDSPYSQTVFLPDVSVVYFTTFWRALLPKINMNLLTLIPWNGFLQSFTEAETSLH